MKLSRLSNRQLRRLLARGEVRFAFDSQKSFQEISRNFKTGVAGLEKSIKALEKLQKGSPSENMRKIAASMISEIEKGLSYIDKAANMGRTII